MPTSPASFSPSDAWDFGPSRWDLCSLLEQEIKACQFAKEDSADAFAAAYANGEGVQEWAIDAYRRFSRLVVTHRARYSQLLHSILKD